ncbi:hypothetical protein [Rhizobium sp. 22-785-1]
MAATQIALRIACLLRFNDLCESKEPIKAPFVQFSFHSARRRPKYKKSPKAYAKGLLHIVFLVAGA